MTTTPNQDPDQTERSSSRRHPALDQLEGHLTAVTYANDVADLQVPAGRHGTVVLPTVLWLPGPATLAKSTHGLLPHHLRWSTATRVVHLTPGRHKLQWRSSSWGRRLEGVVHVDVVDGRFGQPAVISEPQLHSGAVVSVPVVSASSSRRFHAHLRRDGSHARWELFQYFEPLVQRWVDRAVRAVSAELHSKGDVIEDPHDRASIINTVYLGEDGGPESLVDKVIARYTGQLSRPPTDFLRYAYTTIYRGAKLAVRRRIDDPRWVGAALRAFRASHPELPIGELLERFNRTQRRNDKVTYKRAFRALVPCHPVVAVPVPPTQFAGFEIVDGVLSGGRNQRFARVASYEKAAVAAS